MKKRIWTATPLFFVLVSTMFIFTTISIFFDKTLFLIGLILSSISAAIVLIALLKFKKYISFVVNDAIESLSSADQYVLEALPFPAIVVGDKQDVICTNSLFRCKVNNGIKSSGDPISKYISGKSLDYILKHKGIDVSYGGKRFTVYGIKVSHSTVLYFIEDTYYKETTMEYLESRPSVALIVFDNKDELLREVNVEESSQVIAKVEQTLQNWSNETSGILRKLNDNRYMMVIEERYVKLFVERKFRILEEIRNIKTDENRCATISIGIGRNALNLKESELWAKKALDMALGRGGDQAVIKQQDTFSFFGGVSKGTEKLDKVRTRVIANTLSEHIKCSDLVLIMGHKGSDLDSIGASIGLWSAISKGQKIKSRIIIDKKTTLASSLVRMIEESTSDVVFISKEMAQEFISDKTLLIIVDTHSQNFVESIDIYKRCKRVVVIDHHRMMVNHIDNAEVFYHEPTASSSSEMVTELVQYLGESAINSQEAEALLAGIMLDTKNFVLKTGVRTFEAAAFLRKKDANTVVVKRLFSNTINTYKEKYQLVANAEIFNNCAVSVAQKEWKDMKLAAAQAADELLDIQGVRASFVIYPYDGCINVSARSLGDVNVQIFMEELGGGGHQTMAGAQVKDLDMSETREKIIEMINNIV